MQSFEIEYVVSGSLDGVTASPAFQPENEGGDDVTLADNDNIYRFDVIDLGLIDPDFGTGGTFGDRFIVAFWLNSPVAGVDPSPLAVLSTRVREIVQEFVAPSLAGETNFYREQCIFIPQGSLLGLTGFDASADPDDIVVRLHIKQAETLEEYAELLESCCCTQITGCVIPAVDTINPGSVTCGNPPPARTVTLTGGPFSENTTIEVGAGTTCVGATVQITDVTFVNETTMTFLVTCNGTCTLNLKISNGPGCDLLVEDAVTTSGGA